MRENLIICQQKLFLHIREYLSLKIHTDVKNVKLLDLILEQFSEGQPYFQSGKLSDLVADIRASIVFFFNTDCCKPVTTVSS